jgi:hypothetical protein
MRQLSRLLGVGLVLAGTFGNGLGPLVVIPGTAAMDQQPGGTSLQRKPATTIAGQPRACQLTAATRARLARAYGDLPLEFEVNGGQYDPWVKFASGGPRSSFLLTRSGVLISLSRDTDAAGASHHDVVPRANREYAAKRESASVWMKLKGMNRAARIQGARPLRGKTNYLVGNDRALWRTNIATYGEVRYSRVYNGIDLVFHGNRSQLEYDFAVAPGANPSRIRLKFSEVERRFIRC